jgi:hypothetical protein
VSWNEVVGISLSKAPNRLFGGTQLRLYLDGTRPTYMTFQNWQLPFSTRKMLRVASVRFRQQIAEHEIVIRGID